MKNWILRWLGLTPAVNDNSMYANVAAHKLRGSTDGLGEGCKERTYIELIEASNGHIVVARKQVHNPHGPDKMSNEIVIAPDAADLSEAVKRAVATLGLM